MDKRFAYTDIGDFGSNDCVVRAFMQALGMSFEELCKDFHLKSKGGRLKDGFEGLTWMDVPRKYLCRSIALYKWSNWDDNMTVDEFCDITKEVYPGVDFVLGCTGRLHGKKVDHATFVRDGKFHDLHEEVGKWRCYSFFAFRNGKSVHLKEDPDPTFDESGKYIHNIHLENTYMKKINENTKVTLTFEQLKKLVKESTDDPKNKYEPWEQALIDKIGHPHKAPSGCDCLGRPLSEGDWVVFLCAGSRFGAYKTLKVGKVLSVKNHIVIQTFEENWETNEVEADRTSRPSEYVFKIDDPQRVAGSI